MKIFETLYSEIKTILDGVSNVKQVFEAPTSDFTKYPAVVFFPAQMSNAFFTTSDNFREYKFKMFVVVGVDQSTMNFAFKTVLSNTCDAILSAFDTNWKLSNIDGHRAWIRIDTGNWAVEKTDKGLLAVAEFDLVIKLAVNN